MDFDFEFDTGFDLDDDLPPDFYARIILTVMDDAPLLARPRYARAVMGALDGWDDLWGYVIVPGALRVIVGPTTDTTLDLTVNRLKTQTAARVLDAIRRADDDALDMVLRYSPVWGGAIWQVWQAGSHRSIFWSEYKLSNALYDLVQTPVTLGLVETADQWPWTWMSGDQDEC